MNYHDMLGAPASGVISGGGGTDTLATMKPASSQHSERTPINRFRRNGQRQSCEPCRLSKLRCDHESPCSRCVRRRKTCYFHPAPMSRPKPPKRPLSLPTPPSPPRPLAIASTSSAAGTATGPASVSSPDQHKSPVPLVFSGMPTPSDEVVIPDHPDPNSRPPVLSPYRVLGTLPGLIYNRTSMSKYQAFQDHSGITSNAAMLLENRALLKSTEWDTGDAPLAGGGLVEEAVKLGTYILAWWPPRRACERVTARYLEMTGSATTLKPLFRTFVQRFYDTYGDLLEEPRTYAKLEKLSRELCRNTSISRPTRPESSRAFIDSFTGDRSRWDMVAIFFVMFGAMCDLLHDKEQTFQELCPGPCSREEYLQRTIECADNVRYRLLEALDPQGSLLSVLLRAKALNRLGDITGETSSQTWTRAGAVIASATEFDLHRPSPVGTTPALIYTELQKRIFTAAFGTAVNLAAFHGRPPLITRHYISSELPLDCTDEQLLDDDLEGINASIDENGWRLDGQITLASLSRAQAIANILREEVLELSLGQHLAPAALTARVQDARSRLDEAWARLPHLVKIPLRRESFSLLVGAESAKLADVAVLQLKWTMNVFLLERIVHPAQDKSRHLAAARAILTDVVSLWAMRDRFPDNLDDMRWWVSNFGVAACCSLGIDLYQQATNPTAAIGSASYRARDVQTLAKFGACLEWIEPRDGNYTMCQNANKMLQAILERVLTPPGPEGTQDNTDRASGANFESIMDIDLATVGLADVPAFGVDFHDWFNSEWAMPWTGQSYGGLDL